MSIEDLLATTKLFEPTASTKPSADAAFHYYSAEIDQDFHPDLSDAISPRQMFAIREATNSNGTTQLWLGGAGVTAHTHYDPTHNFFVQVRGRKRFILSPPSSAFSLYLHPFQHPGYRQSQVDYAKSQASKYPLFGQAEAYVADLGPGDVLYLPPYWFHRGRRSTPLPMFNASNIDPLPLSPCTVVESLTPSLSINVWSDSMEGDVTEDATAKGLPKLLRSAPQTQEHQRLRVAGLARFAASLVVAAQVHLPRYTDAITGLDRMDVDSTELLPRDLASGFLQLLAHTRHAPLSSDPALRCSADSKPDPQQQASAPRVCPNPLSYAEKTQLDKMLQDFGDVIADIARIFLRLQSAPPAAPAVDPLQAPTGAQPEPASLASTPEAQVFGTFSGVREIVLMDYLEQVAGYVVGVNNLCYFFTSCLPELLMKL